MAVPAVPVDCAGHRLRGGAVSVLDGFVVVVLDFRGEYPVFFDFFRLCGSGCFSSVFRVVRIMPVSRKVG